MTRWTWGDFQKGKKRKNKYNNTKVVFDGKTFDSEHEASVHAELKVLERGGIIRQLQLELRFIILDP